MSFAYGYGPYTVEDLHGLPDNGRSYELVDGLVDRVGAQYQAPMDISAPSGARKPDVAVIDANAASSARRLGRSLYHGADVLLAVEVVSRSSDSEREDRGRKVTEYALAGIPQSWIVDFDPEPQIQILRLTDDPGRYGTSLMFGGDDTVKIEDPFPVSFPLSDLQDFA